MTVRHGASLDRRLVRAQMTLAAYVPAATSAAERRPRTRRVANATRAMLRSAVDAIGRSAGPMSLAPGCSKRVESWVETRRPRGVSRARPADVPDGCSRGSSRAHARRYLAGVTARARFQRTSDAVVRSRSASTTSRWPQGQPVDKHPENPGHQPQDPIDDRQRPRHDQEKDRDEAPMIAAPADDDDLRPLPTHGSFRVGVATDPARLQCLSCLAPAPGWGGTSGRLRRPREPVARCTRR